MLAHAIVVVMDCLETKGLFGLLVRSAPDEDGTTHIRHIHPVECQALNGMDPVIDFGVDVRLTLSAVGQLASPLQAVWIFSFASNLLDQFQFGKTSFSPEANLIAFRAWLMARSRLVWPLEHDFLQGTKIFQLMQFWLEHIHLSLPELMYLQQWDEIRDCSLGIGAVLDLIIRKTPVVSPDVNQTLGKCNEPSPPITPTR